MTKSGRIVAAKLRRALAQLPHLPRVLTLVWEAAGLWTGAWVSLLIIQALLPVAVVYLVKTLVDELVAGIGLGAGWPTIRPILLDVALLAGVMLLMEIARGLTAWVRAVQSEQVQDHILGLIHTQATVVDLAFYETPEYYDHLHRARTEASYRPIELIESLGGIFQNGLTLVAMAGILAPYGWWLPLALLVSTLPALVAVLHFSVREHLWRRTNTPEERRAWYYDWLLTTGDAAAELRSFDLGRYFRSAYQAIRGRLRSDRLRLVRDRSAAETAAGALGLLVTGLVIGWMVWRVLRGEVTLGDLALFYQAFSQGQRLMRTLLENAGQVYGSVLFLGDLFEFLELEPRVISPAHPLSPPISLQDGIRFERVTFRYPGSRRMALKEFDLFIPRRQFVAFVGPNGAGKSTVIKLICRLYDPDEGRITLDGTDVREFDLEELRSRLSVLFQDPVRYNASAADNVGFGDWAASPSMERITAAARIAGADQAIVGVGGYEALLGRWFAGGAELSVGEWQRIALARVLLRRAPILCLDEPTSAMDSWAEAEWLGRLRETCRESTVIMITHRFTTAYAADMIHVLSDGYVVESGEHRELTMASGIYARSWKTQQEGPR